MRAPPHALIPTPQQPSPPITPHLTLASAPCSNEIPLVEMSNSGELGEEPVSTLGTPMRLFGKHTLPYGHSAAVRRP